MNDKKKSWLNEQETPHKKMHFDYRVWSHPCFVKETKSSTPFETMKKHASLFIFIQLWQPNQTWLLVDNYVFFNKRFSFTNKIGS